MLNEKRREAGKQGIHTDFYVEPGVLLQHVAPMDLISMLGNLLDNAIRAAAETHGEKYIKSYIYMKEVGGFCVIKITNPFENIKHIDENGIEFWYARELMKVLSYKDWRYFDAVIKKARIACQNSEITDIDHFVVDNKMVEIGSGAKREQKDYKLTRYACYLIALSLIHI